MRFDKFPGFSWLSEEIFLQTKISMNFPQTFVAPIVLVHQNYKLYFAMDTNELQTQEGKFALLKSSVQNLERKLLWLWEQNVAYVLL